MDNHGTNTASEWRTEVFGDLSETFCLHTVDVSENEDECMF